MQISHPSHLLIVHLCIKWKNFKKMKKLFFALFLVETVCSCSDINSFSDTINKDGILMSALDFKAEETTRSSLLPSSTGTKFRWDKGDVVGVYSSSKGLTNFFIDENTISSDGTSANFNGSGFSLNSNSTYYAFYPYSKSSLNKSEIPISYSSQVMMSNGDFKSLGDFDYMCSMGESDEENHAAFTFSHLGCVVEFKLKVPVTSKYTAAYFELDNASKDNCLIKGGNVDLTSAEGVFIPKVNENDSILKVSLGENGIFVEKDSFLTVYMMMPPQNLSGKSLAVRLYDNQANWYKAEIEGKNMRSGYTYHYVIDGSDGKGFTATGTGLPNDLELSYVSSYVHPTKKGYNWLSIDNENADVLWATGSFGIRKISYAAEKYPSLVVENAKYMSKDQIGRVCLPVGSYLYAGLRQNSSGERELYSPKVSLRFEDRLQSVSSNNSKSNNSVLNDFFQELSLYTFDKSKIDEVWLFKAGNDGSGTYKNVIQFRSNGVCMGNLFRRSFSSKEEALSNLPTSISDAYKNKAVVNWDAISSGMHIFKNVEFYNLGTGEFSSIDCTGSLVFDELTKGSLNRGGNCAHFVTSNNVNNSIKLVRLLDETSSTSSISWMMKLNTIPNENVNIPLLSMNGTEVATLNVVSNISGYTLGVTVNGKKILTSQVYDVKQWYNFKLDMSSSGIKLSSRTKETGEWNLCITSGLSGSCSVNEISLGVNTMASNLDLCVDDVFYDSSNVDNVSYVNGALVVFDKNDLSIKNKYYLDYKVCGLACHKNTLVVTCLNGINVYDIKDMENPKLIYTYRPSSYREYQGVSIYEAGNRTYAIISTYLWGFSILDITDANDIKMSKELDFSNFILDGKNLKNKVFTFDVIADYPYAYATLATYRTSQNTEYDHRGVMILELNDLDNIKMDIVEYPSNRFCQWQSGDPAPARITKSGNRIVINNDDNGIEVFTITSPGKLEYTDGISMPATSSVNAVTSTPNGKLFVGSRGNDSGIYMYEGLR